MYVEDVRRETILSAMQKAKQGGESAYWIFGARFYGPLLEIQLSKSRSGSPFT